MADWELSARVIKNDNDTDKRRQVAELRLSMRASSASAIKKEEWYARMQDWGMI
jgi:hypothetical protein